jgi:hypothetical protein
MDWKEEEEKKVDIHLLTALGMYFMGFRLWCLKLAPECIMRFGDRQYDLCMIACLFMMPILVLNIRLARFPGLEF